MFKNNFFYFLNKLKIKNLNIFTFSLLFYKNNNLIFLSFLNFNKKQKFYIFNMVYLYQLNYVYLNNNILRFYFKNFNFQKIFVFYTQNLKKFLFFLKDLYIYKNKYLNVYINNDIKISSAKNNFNFINNEYLNSYKHKKKIYFKKFILKNIDVGEIDEDLQENSSEYYLNDILYPEYEFRDIYNHNLIKNSFNLYFIKLKNNFINYNFFKNIIFFSDKLKFFDNLKNLFYYFLFIWLKIFINFLNNLCQFFLFYSLIYQKLFSNDKY